MPGSATCARRSTATGSPFTSADLRPRQRRAGRRRDPRADGRARRFGARARRLPADRRALRPDPRNRPLGDRARDRGRRRRRPDHDQRLGALDLRPGLPPHIAGALRRSGADPANVVFEITETAAATASDELRAFGARIEQLGCALAIDDFGTGFGSLTYLKHLPVRYLKIDMEFVRGINDSAADRAIVQSIVTIAQSLGMQTIGEGVEDEKTLETLTGLGVDYAQGYHLGRPVALSA